MAEAYFLNVNTEVVIDRSRVAELLDYLLAPFPRPKNFRTWEMTGTGVRLLQPVQGLYRPVRVYTFVPRGLQTKVVVEAHCETDSNRWIKTFQLGRFEKSERQHLRRLLDKAREFKSTGGFREPVVSHFSVKTSVVVASERIPELLTYLNAVYDPKTSDRYWRNIPSGIELVARVERRPQVILRYSFVPLATETKVVVEAYHRLPAIPVVGAWERRRLKVKERSNLEADIKDATFAADLRRKLDAQEVEKIFEGLRARYDVE